MMRLINQPADPNQWRAHQAVQRALADGRLTMPAVCSQCDEKKPLVAHHPFGYESEQMLHVEWLCKVCHRRAHSHGPKKKVMVYMPLNLWRRLRAVLATLDVTQSDLICEYVEKSLRNGESGENG